MRRASRFHPVLVVFVIMAANTLGVLADDLEIVKEQKWVHKDFEGVGIKRVMFTGDGKTLATAGYQYVRLWDVSADEAKQTAASPKIDFGVSGLWTMALSADGKRVAAGGGDHRLRLYDVSGTDLKEVAVQKDQDGTIRSLAFSPDGSVLASGSDDKTIWLYDISGDKPKELTTFKPAKAGSAMLSLQFLADGKSLLFGYQGGQGNVGIEDVSGKPAKEVGALTEKNVFRATISPDGKMVALFNGNDVKLYDVDGGKFKERSVLKGHSKQGMAVSFSPDSKYLASAGKDSKCIVWDVGNGQQVFSKERSGDIEDVAFAPAKTEKGELRLAMPTHQREVYLYTLRAK